MSDKVLANMEASTGKSSGRSAGGGRGSAPSGLLSRGSRLSAGGASC